VPVQVPWEAVEDTNVVPAGSVSDTVTPVAAVLPVCEAVIASLMLPPVCGTVAGAVFDTVTSEVAATPAWVVVAVELSLRVLSFGVRVIEAVFVNVNVPVVVLAGTETTIVTVADDVPAASVPTRRASDLVPVQVPWEAVEDTNVVPAGSVS